MQWGGLQFARSPHRSSTFRRSHAWPKRQRSPQRRKHRRRPRSRTVFSKVCTQRPGSPGRFIFVGTAPFSLMSADFSTDLRKPGRVAGFSSRSTLNYQLSIAAYAFVSDSSQAGQISLYAHPLHANPGFAANSFARISPAVSCTVFSASSSCFASRAVTCT